MPTALVLSAGGMFAAWEVGVWNVLRDHVQPDLIVGASAGSWNGWAIAGGATCDDLAREWRDPLIASLMAPGLHRAGWLRPEALHAKARELYNRFRPRIPFGLTVVEVPRMRACLVRDDAIRWEHLAAACSIPLGFPPVSIDGRRYVDGGLLGALPVWAAGEMGATRAIAVNCLTNWPFRLMRLLLRPPACSGAVEIVRIEPERPLAPFRGAVFWSAANIERWIELGERDGKRALSRVRM